MPVQKIKYQYTGTSIVETVTLTSGVYIDNGEGEQMLMDIPISYGMVSGITTDAPISKTYISEDPANGTVYGYIKQTATGFYVHPILGMTNLSAEPDPHYPDGIALINGNLYKCIDNIWMGIEEGADTVKFTTDFDANLTDWTDNDGTDCESTYQSSKALDFTINDVLQLYDNSATYSSKRTKTITGYPTVFSFWMGTSNVTYSCIFEFNESTQIGYIAISAGALYWGGTSISTGISNNIWYHITLQFNASTDKVKIWINGIYNSEQNCINPISVGITSVNIWTWTTSSGYYQYVARPYFGNSLSEALWSYYQYKGPTVDAIQTATQAQAACIETSAITEDLTTKSPSSQLLFDALAGKIANSLGTTKGSLVGFSAASTALRIPSGTEGQVLTMLSGQTAGIGWQTLAGGGVPSVQTPIYPCSRAADFAWNSTDDYLEYSSKSTGTKNCYLYPVTPSGTTAFVIYGNLAVEGINAIIYLSGVIEYYRFSQDGWVEESSTGISFYDSDGMGTGASFVMSMSTSVNISSNRYRIRMAYHTNNVTAAYQCDIRGLRTT